MASRFSQVVVGGAIAILPAVPIACGGDDAADCAATQTCISGAGEGGEDSGNGGTSPGGNGGSGGARGGTGGSAAIGGSGGQGGASGTNSSGGTGGDDGGAGAGGDMGGAGMDGAGMGGVVAGMGGAGKGGAGNGGAGKGGAGNGGAGKGGAGNGGAGMGGAGMGGAGTGGAGMGGAGMGGGGTGTVDTTPPTVVSVSPVNGATGVLANATIAITFSEPMNPTTTANSFQSADIPNSAAAFAWSQNNTRLTITPNAGFAYASGTDPGSVVARTYAATMTDNAVDAAGNRLVDDHAWSFRTARRIAQTLLPAPLGGSQYWALSRSTDGATRPCPTFASHFGLGELGPSVSNINGPLFIAIELAGLPAGILNFETAYLSANQTVVSQAYAPGNLGVIRANHLTGNLMTTPVPWVYQSTVLRVVGVFSSTPSLGVKSLDVSVALADDYAQRSARANKSMYTLEFDMAYADINIDGNSSNDYAYFDCGSVQLDATYLVP